MSRELVFVTVPLNSMDDIDIDADVLLDYGTTDRKGHGYLALRQGPKVRGILDDLALFFVPFRLKGRDLRKNIRPITYKLASLLGHA